MSLEEFHRLLRPLLAPEHWALVDEPGQFRDPAQRCRALLRHETDVAIEWGRQEEPGDQTGWSVPWAGERIITEMLDVVCRAELVDRVIVARVGGRALIPLPLPTADGLLVSDWECDAARLVHDLEKLSGFDELLMDSRITTIGEWPTERAKTPV